MKKTLRFTFTLLCIALSGLSVQAATKYWDIDGATAGAGGATPAGTWDIATTANWTTDATGASAGTAFTNNDDAVFSAGTDASGTFAIVLNGTPIVGNLTNEEGTITISGGTALNIGGGVALKGNIDVLPNSTLTISSVITGGDNSGSITKGISGGTGTGTLVFSGANTYTNQTVVYVGTISFNTIGNVVVGGPGVPSALGAPTSVAGGTLKMGGTTNAVTLKYTGTGHSTDRVINMAGGASTVTLDASGSGALVFTSATGVTATTSGLHVLQLAGTNTAANTITGLIVDNSPAAARITQLRKVGPGTWVLTGVSTFTGVCDVRDGTLIINSIANKGTSSAIGSGNLNNANATIGLGSETTTGTLKYVGTTAGGHSSSRPFTLWGSTGGGAIDASGVGPLILSGTFAHSVFATANKTLTLKGTNTGANTISSAIPDSISTPVYKTLVTKDGTGKWVLSGVSTYTGATTVSGGTLLVNSPGALAAGSAVSVAADATLGGNGTINGPVTVGAGGTLSPGASIGTLTLTLAPSLNSTSTNLMEINRTNSPNADKLVVSTGGGSLTNNGTLTVVNTGPALQANDTFDLFDADGFSGAFSVTNLPALDPGLKWNTSQLVVNGTISVESLCSTATVNAGSDQTVCASSPTVTLAGSFAVATNAIWSGGAGGFSPNNTTTNATYTPTAGEITAGTVTLTLTTDAGVTCGSVNDSMTITINPAATVNAGSDQAICADVSATLAGSFGGAATNATWTTSGDGLFGNNTVTNTTYTPGTADKAAGTVTLTLTTGDPNGPCPAVNGFMVLTINALTAITNQPTSQAVCAGSSASFTVEAAGTTLAYQWQMSGDGGTTFTNISATATNASYTNLTTTLADNGIQYQVIVVGLCGSVTSAPSAVLTVNSAAAINDQPTNQTVCANSPAVFTVGATGAGLTYQWQASGDGGATFTNISATATNASYTNLFAAPTDNGQQYQVIVAGSCGPAVTSAPPAVLTIFVPALNVAHVGANAVLSWPLSCINYVLEAKGDLDPLTTWTPVADPVVPVGDQNTVTTTLVTTNQFFRLRNP